jgi:hypothetical protein
MEWEGDLLADHGHLGALGDRDRLFKPSIRPV